MVRNPLVLRNDGAPQVSSGGKALKRMMWTRSILVVSAWSRGRDCGAPVGAREVPLQRGGISARAGKERPCVSMLRRDRRGTRGRRYDAAALHGAPPHQARVSRCLAIARVGLIVVRVGAEGFLKRLCRRVQGCQDVIRQLDRRGTGILDDLLGATRPRQHRRDAGLAEEPCQGEVGHGNAGTIGDGADAANGGKGLFLVARLAVTRQRAVAGEEAGARSTCGDLVGTSVLAREESLLEGAVDDNPDVVGDAGVTDAELMARHSRL